MTALTNLSISHDDGSASASPSAPSASLHDRVVQLLAAEFAEPVSVRRPVGRLEDCEEFQRIGEAVEVGLGNARARGVAVRVEGQLCNDGRDLMVWVVDGGGV